MSGFQRCGKTFLNQPKLPITYIIFQWILSALPAWLSIVNKLWVSTAEKCSINRSGLGGAPTSCGIAHILLKNGSDLWILPKYQSVVRGLLR